MIHRVVSVVERYLVSVVERYLVSVVERYLVSVVERYLVIQLFLQIHCVKYVKHIRSAWSADLVFRYWS
jgi:hypothetical protein